MSKEKARYFTFLLYPESIPNDWIDKLELIGVPIAISPLHDKDLSDIEGQKYKKEHYHVIYVSKNPVTAESVRLKVKRSLGDKSVAMVQIISTSMENMYLYLTHESKDASAKNKHKYKRSEIKLINNFDIDRYITLDVEDKEDLFNEICDIIDDHDLANMRELKNFVKYHGAEYGLPSMKVIRSVMKMSSGIIRLTFDAVYQERRYGKQIDNETGEIK